ncbi:hypothetical protein BH24BAC1_BH24BAC1_40170 [soil metagenome]
MISQRLHQLLLLKHPLRNSQNTGYSIKEGMRFNHFNVAKAVCTISGVVLLTGCYTIV